VHQIDAELLADRHQDRHEQGDRRDRFEETADDEHQHVREQQEHPGRLREREHPDGDRVG